jgi:hypothetical protein
VILVIGELNCHLIRVLVKSVGLCAAVSNNEIGKRYEIASQIPPPIDLLDVV